MSSYVQQPGKTTFDETMLREIRKEADASLFFFARAILGLNLLTENVHQRWCDQLQGLWGEWERLCFCAFRGSFKTSLTSAFVLWYGLTRINRSVLLVEANEDNAIAHVKKLLFQLETNVLLQAVYADRLMPGLAGCSATELTFVRTDPNADPFLRCGGIHSGFEGKHVDLLWMNDLEGADAEKSNVENQEAAFFLFNRAEPLLTPSARKPQMLLEGTPHGDKPLMHRVRKMEADGSTRWSDRVNWKMIWLPVRDENGQPTIPEVKSSADIQRLQVAADHDDEAKKALAQHYDLLETVELGGGFDMGVIRRNFFEIHAGSLIRYPVYNVDIDSIDPETGAYSHTIEWKTVHMGYCRAFIHGDPTHRELNAMRSKQRPSVDAIIVTLVSPDFHVFVVDTFIQKAGIDGFAENFVRLYRKWGATWTAPPVCTFEAVGAQIWFPSYLKRLEKAEYSRGYHAFQRPWDPSMRRLPKLSARVVESYRAHAEKEAYIIQQLQAWHNWGWLHLHPNLTTLLRHHEVFPTEAEPIDGCDALAQGPSVWKPPMSAAAKQEIARRSLMMQLLASRRGTYETPWAHPGAGPPDGYRDRRVHAIN